MRILWHGKALAVALAVAFVALAVALAVAFVALAVAFDLPMHHDTRYVCVLLCCQ